MPKVVRRSGTNDPAAAATAAAATETMVEIVVNIEGTTIPITLTQSECTELSWGEFCKIVVEKYLPKVDPTLLLKILAKISPNKRLSHYKARVGDGCAIIMKVNWSPAGIPGFARLPFEPSYTEVNMALEPTEGGALQLMAKPHLPLLQPVEGEPVPTSLDVNLVIMAVSADHPPLPSNVARTSVVTINEHLSFPGCLDKFSVEAANGENDILPDQSSLAVSSSAPVTAATSAGKRKASPKQATASTKKKAKNAKKNNDDAKKAAAKKGGAAAAAKKKTPPEESAVDESKTPSKKAGMDMIRKYEAAKAKQLNESSSSSKTDSPSIPKVISSKKTTKITPKKGKATTTAAKDDSAAKKPSASTNEAGRDRALSIDKGNEMLRVYEESKAKGNASAGKENKTPSKKSKESGESTKASSSSKKATKSSSKKGKAKGDEEKSAKKPPVAAAAAAAKEDSGEDDKAAPSVDNGKKMLSVWLAAQEKEAGSKKTEDSTKPSGKKAKGSSKKKDEAKAEKGESSAKKPSAAEEGKSAKKKAKTAAASEATKVSKKKRKAPSSEDNTADASKSPSKKKAKSSKGDEKLTPAKDDGKKSAAASKKADSEVKKRGPKRKDYDDIPSEPAADFPEGWTSKNIPRSSGDKYDQRWYSPGGMTFNTKKGATMFEEFVKDGNDEATAYKLFKKAEKEAKEKRKAKKEAEAMEKK